MGGLLLVELLVNPRFLNLLKDLLSLLLFLQDSSLEVSRLSSILRSLILQLSLQFEILFCQKCGLLATLFHQLLLILFQHALLCFLSLRLKRCLSIKQLILRQQVLPLSIAVIAQQHASIIVLIVNLLEVPILSSPLLSLLNGVLHLQQLSLVTHQHGIFTQVVVSIIMICLDGLVGLPLGQELHLLHLLLGKSH